MLTINLSQEIETELNELATQRHTPVEQLVNDLILGYLEDLHDAALGDAAMDELMRGEDAIVSFDEVKQQLGLIT
jgi:RHH-type transcriptional regulator, rel operon repressor / antitoxin RelB